MLAIRQTSDFFCPPLEQMKERRQCVYFINWLITSFMSSNSFFSCCFRTLGVLAVCFRTLVALAVCFLSNFNSSSIMLSKFSNGNMSKLHQLLLLVNYVYRFAAIGKDKKCPCNWSCDHVFTYPFIHKSS